MLLKIAAALRAASSVLQNEKGSYEIEEVWAHSWALMHVGKRVFPKEDMQLSKRKSVIERL